MAHFVGDGRCRSDYIFPLVRKLINRVFGFVEVIAIHELHLLVMVGAQQYVHEHGTRRFVHRDIIASVSEEIHGIVLGIFYRSSCNIRPIDTNVTKLKIKSRK